MKIHRFIGNFDFSEPEILISDPEIINQLKNVLRLSAGDMIILGDGNSNEAEARIVSLHKTAADLHLEKVYKNLNEPARAVRLYCAILKRENFELVVQKATEAGVREIIPVIAKRTVKTDIRRDRLEKIIKEAAEQAGRGLVPILDEVSKFEIAVTAAAGNGAVNVLFDASGLPRQPPVPLPDSLNIWIGPEGGWEPEELKIAGENKFEVAGLGQLTLRAETAAIVAAYLAVHAPQRV